MSHVKYQSSVICSSQDGRFLIVAISPSFLPLMAPLVI